MHFYIVHAVFCFILNLSAAHRHTHASSGSYSRIYTCFKRARFFFYLFIWLFLFWFAYMSVCVVFGVLFSSSFLCLLACVHSRAHAQKKWLFWARNIKWEENKTKKKTFSEQMKETLWCKPFFCVCNVSSWCILCISHIDCILRFNMIIK